MRKLSTEHQWFEFGATIQEQHLSTMWASINANWGMLEYELWQVLADLNPADAHEWTLHFFSREVGKGELVANELRILTSGDQQLLAGLENGLAQIAEAKKLRNPLIHGLWRHEGSAIKVQPLLTCP